MKEKDVQELEEEPFHNKHRPTCFEEFMGNEKTVHDLKVLLDKKNRPHAYLFVGPKGSGKTTLGQIVANYLECAKNEFREMNVANVRGIDTIREVISESQFTPLDGGIKVYLFDEAAKLTNDAQHALLKFLERPPKHVYLILATTDPEKLLPTVRDRCTTYTLTSFQPEELKTLLKKVVQAEGTTMREEILTKVAEAANGSPRKALVILEQIISLSPREALSAINKIHVDEFQTIDLCRAILKREPWSQIATIIKGLDQEPESIRRAIMGYLGNVLLSSGDHRVAEALEQFRPNLYDTGRPGLILECYKATL